MRSVFHVVALVVLAGCRTSIGPEPQLVPSSQELAPACVEVLQVTVEATASGYRVVNTKRTKGAPTDDIVQDREVRIIALDAAGKTLRMITVDNPRAVHTTGSRRPAEATLDRAVFTVRFPDPDAIAALDIQVVRGPNAKYTTRLAMRP